MTTIVKQLNQEIDTLKRHLAFEKSSVKLHYNNAIELREENENLKSEIKVLDNSRESWKDDALRYQKNAEYWQDMYQKTEFDKLQSTPQSQEEVAEQVIHAGAEFNYVVPVPSLGVYIHINLTPIQEALNAQVK